MDKSFHEIQAKVAKRLIHSDRHRRRKSIAPDIVACTSKNHDLSRLMLKNEVLFKNLEDKMSSLENEQRRRKNELLRTERALVGSVRKRSLPHLTKYQGREKSPALRQSRRNSLATSELRTSVSPNQLVQEWLQRLDRNKNTSKNTLEVPPFFHPQLEPKSASETAGKSGFDSELIGAESGNEPMASTTFVEGDRASSRQCLYTLAAKIRISDGEENGAR